jgi:septum formation protein
MTSPRDGLLSEKNKDSPLLFIPHDPFYTYRQDFFKTLGLEVLSYDLPDLQGLIHLKSTPKLFLHAYLKEQAQALSPMAGPSLVIFTGLFCGRRYLGPPKSETEALAMIRLLSGRRHRVYTAFSIKHQGAPLGPIKIVETAIKTKVFSEQDRDALLKAFPLYPVSHTFEQRLHQVIGSYGNLKGLPALEMHHRLQAEGLIF